MSKEVKFRSENNADFLAAQAVHLLSDIKTDESIVKLFENIKDGLVVDEEFQGEVIASKIKLTPELLFKLTEFATTTNTKKYAKIIVEMLADVAIARKEYTQDCVDALFQVAKELPADKAGLKVDTVEEAVRVYMTRPLAVQERVNTAFQSLGTAVYHFKGFFNGIFNSSAQDRRLNESLGRLQYAVDIARIADFSTAIDVKGNNPVHKKTI